MWTVEDCRDKIWSFRVLGLPKETLPSLLQWQESCTIIEYERILKDVTHPCNKFVSLVKTNQYDLEPVGFDHIVVGSEVSWGYTSNRKARYHHGLACEQALWVKESLQGSLWYLRACVQYLDAELWLVDNWFKWSDWQASVNYTSRL
jgi:hypothetical protein